MLSEEKGQSMVIFPILLIALIGFAGLAVDGGRLYIAKSQLQKAVDAGALAGADAILEGKETGPGFNYSTAETTAESVAKSNYDSGIPYKGTAELDTSKNVNYVRVNGEEDVQLMLMPVLGLTKISKVTAAAKVIIGDVVTADGGGLIPIGINVKDPAKELVPGKVWDLTAPPGEGNTGKYGFLDFSTLEPESKKNQGTKDLDDYIQNGSPKPISIGDKLDVREGKPVNALTINKKIVYVPIVSKFEGKNKEKVEVLGFVAFELIPPDKHSKTIQGKLIRTVMPGDIGDISLEYGTYSSKLIE